MIMNDYPSNYREDNPGGEWLKNKQEDAEEYAKKYKTSGYHQKKLSGAVTASSRVKIPVKHLSNLKGTNNESRGPGDPQYDALNKSVKANGYDDKSPILIQVNHHGEAFTTEGNTRIAVARDNNVKHITTEIQWKNGAEQIKGKWHPTNVAKMEKETNKMNEELNEHLSKSASASDYINDFIHSKNKTFKGHSKKERIKQALAVYYSKREEQEIMNDKIIKEISSDKLNDYHVKAVRDVVNRGKAVDTLLNNRVKGDKVSLVAAKKLEDKNTKRLDFMKKAKDKVNNVQELSDVVLNRYSHKAKSDIESRGLKAREAFIDDKSKSSNMIKKNLKRIKGQELADSKVRKHNNMNERIIDEGKTFKDRDINLDRKSNSIGRAIKRGYEQRQLARAQKSKERDYASMREAEEIDEISMSKLSRYTDAADRDLDSRGKFIDSVIKKGKSPSKTLKDKQLRRLAGIHTAVSKVINTAKVPATNEEEIDEISSSLARSYYSKAATDRRGREDFSDYMESKGKDVSLTHERKLLRRDRGIRNVEKKLYGKAKVPSTNEEEEVNEISSKTLGSYINKSAHDIDNRSFGHGYDFAGIKRDTDDTRKDMDTHEQGIAKRRFYIRKATDKLVSRTKDKNSK